MTTVAARRASPTPAPAGATRARSSRRAGPLAMTALTWLVVFLVFFPVLWMMFTAFKSERDAATFPPTIFVDLSLDGFSRVFDRGFSIYLLN